MLISQKKKNSLVTECSLILEMVFKKLKPSLNVFLFLSYICFLFSLLWTPNCSTHLIKEDNLLEGYGVCHGTRGQKF